MFDSGKVHFWSFVSEGDPAALLSLVGILGASFAGKDSGLSGRGLSLSLGLEGDVVTSS